ncbi:MAG: ABC transporter substrate-binding protein [Cyanobacteria bacterium CRU_2_1]|nr:ABC transporter substrate-binding protein [Cyanobacteria bacterium RU_5_0]NJR60002.1 ABC transporter substrate-binding protein [Cyanobacteria bacterium CRU_2_1]
MSQKNETPVLLLALLVTLALIAGGFWLLSNRLNLGNLFARDNAAQDGAAQDGSSDQTQSVPLQDRFSTGSTLLFTEGASSDKQEGIEAISSKNYDQAITALEASLTDDRNDPEALIYLNNARIRDRASYTLAVAVPTAKSPDPALEILRGVAQAQDQINQTGGINGIPLKVMIVNDDNDPDVSMQVATALVKDPTVLGVIGHFGSDATLAAAGLYQEGRLVMISPTSTSVQVSNEGDYVFRTVPSDRFTAAALSRYMLNTLNMQKAAIYFNSQSDYSQSLKEELTTALNTEGGAAIEFDVSEANFNARTTLDQAKQQNVQVLILATNTPTLDQALQVIQENDRTLPLLGGDSLYNPGVLEDGKESAERMVVAVPWIILSNPQTEFVQTSRRLWGGDVSWRTAMSYDATEVLIEGLRRNPTRQGVQQALNTPGFSVAGATGTIEFLRSGDRNQPMQLVVIEPGSRSGYGYDFVPVR